MSEQNGKRIQKKEAKEKRPSRLSRGQKWLLVLAADTCILPRVEKAKVTPCDDAQISPFIKEVRGNRREPL